MANHMDMKKPSYFLLLGLLFMVIGCTSSSSNQAPAADTGRLEATVGQSGVKDDVSNPNVVQVAVGSADHTTLVTAVKAASLVDVLSNAGPFTVFAPTDKVSYVEIFDEIQR